MTSYTIKEIPADSFFTMPAFLDTLFILTAPETPFTNEVKQALENWEFTELFSEGEPQADYPPESAPEAVSQAVDNDPLTSEEQIRWAEEFYAAFCRYTDALFAHIIDTEKIDFNEVATMVKKVCSVLKDDRRFLLRVIKKHKSEISEDYLSAHAVNSTIISIIIGVYLKLPDNQLIELGVAAMLHEVGMIKLPPQIYLNKGALSPDERKAILSHPVISYNMLKALNFPLPVSIAALEHHERENGEGYPRRLTGSKISLYAKIIAVACSYTAITTDRPHKDAENGYSGIVDLLKNAGHQYDDRMVQALVYSLSIYPIGLYVLLSSGKNGQVVDVNPQNPRFPIVQIFGELTAEGKNKIQATSVQGLSIVGPLTREEIDSL